ncbi:hypothetical protein Sjap_011224 [Stephania japonica]|uniref:DUF761 domain-containing protein n=1 Tax=Stephania japonica TaxID=461633 RepID=A0AAP0JAQ8_9MAGN
MSSLRGIFGEVKTMKDDKSYYNSSNNGTQDSRFSSTSLPAIPISSSTSLPRKADHQWNLKSNQISSHKTLARNESMDIDKCAEAFIQRFRQQLQIQRLASLEDYEKMLARGL